jgi:hypothetical protein
VVRLGQQYGPTLLVQGFEQQAPPMHIEPLGHTLPHVPQLLLSVFRSAQVVPLQQVPLQQVPLQQWGTGCPGRGGVHRPQQVLPQGGAQPSQQTPLTVLHILKVPPIPIPQQVVLPLGPVQTWELGQQAPPTQVLPESQQVVVPQGVVPDGQHIPDVQVLPAQQSLFVVHFVPRHVQFPATQV